MKIKTKSYYKKRAWKAFSEYIRHSNIKPNGDLFCYTCDKFLYWKEAQAGHGLGGRHNAVLFMEAVVKPQCRQCNIFKQGNYTVFTRNLIKEYGLKKYDQLVTESQKVVQYKSSDYMDIEKKYKEKLNNL